MLIIRYLEKKPFEATGTAGTVGIAEGDAHIAAVTDAGVIYPLPQKDFMAFVHEAEDGNLSPLMLAEQYISKGAPIAASLESMHLLAPVVAPEVWAAGVTYERSRDARNYEVSKTAEQRPDEAASKKDNGAGTFYDLVYDAIRPELFLKSSPLRTVGPDEELCIRSDSKWQIPEPELGLVLNKQGDILGYTIGNDMSSRDIEGENPLYLPQAKVWRRSCAIGPAIRLAETVKDPYDLQITLLIYRGGQQVVEGTVNTRQLKRKLPELVSFLIRDNDIYDGTVLLTGTGIVPPNEFSLQSGDRIDILISGIGMLRNTIK